METMDGDRQMAEQITFIRWRNLNACLQKLSAHISNLGISQEKYHSWLFRQTSVSHQATTRHHSSPARTNQINNSLSPYTSLHWFDLCPHWINTQCHALHNNTNKKVTHTCSVASSSSTPLYFFNSKSRLHWSDIKRQNVHSQNQSLIFVSYTLTAYKSVYFGQHTVPLFHVLLSTTQHSPESLQRRNNKANHTNNTL